jgi:hypothetical protein
MIRIIRDIVKEPIKCIACAVDLAPGQYFYRVRSDRGPKNERYTELCQECCDYHFPERDDHGVVDEETCAKAYTAREVRCPRCHQSFLIEQ